MFLAGCLIASQSTNISIKSVRFVFLNLRIELTVLFNIEQIVGERVKTGTTVHYACPNLNIIILTDFHLAISHSSKLICRRQLKGV